MRFWVPALALKLCFGSAQATDCSQLVSNLIESKTAEAVPDRPSAELLGNKIFAIHATKYIPKDGIIRAGKSPGPGFRPTTHFSLGEVVHSHSAGDWDDVPYAVVTPLKSLEPQLMSLMAFDTFTMGDFAVPREGWLVIPESDKTLAPKNINIHTYDPARKNLREATHELVENLGGWKIRSESGADWRDEAFIGDKNINTPKFFDAYFKRYPHLSWGLHVNSIKGDADLSGWLARWTNYNLYGWFKDGESALEQSRSPMWDKVVAEEHMNSLERSLKSRSTPLPKESWDTFNEVKRKTKKWMNLIEIDQWFRTNHNASFLTARLRESERASIMLLADDPKALKKYLLELNEDWRKFSSRARPLGYNPTFSNFDPASLDPISIRRLAKDLKDPSQKESVLMDYASRRISRMGFKRAQSEGSVEMYLNLVKARAAKNPAWNILEDGSTHKPLFSTESRKEDIEFFLRQAPVRDALRERSGISLPPNATLDDFLRQFPETASLYNKSGTDTAFLKAIHRFPKTPFKNIAEAMKVSASLSESREQVTRFANDYYFRYKGATWRDSGLLDELVQLYPTEESYVNSGKSLAEIVIETAKLERSRAKNKQ